MGLPVGIEDFKEIRTEGFYYVDKTRMITELLNDRNKVTLFTRPKRFGKSLNMSLLEHFFSYGCDPTLFDGLAIAGKKELYEKYMGKYPVISISLKSVEGLDCGSALAMLRSTVCMQARNFYFFLINEYDVPLDKVQQLIDDEMETILKYGVACRRKTCMVRMAPRQAVSAP